LKEHWGLFPSILEDLDFEKKEKKGTKKKKKKKTY
jgi:hypothetical protein